MATVNSDSIYDSSAYAGTPRWTTPDHGGSIHVHRVHVKSSSQIAIADVINLVELRPGQLLLPALCSFEGAATSSQTMLLKLGSTAVTTAASVAANGSFAAATVTGAAGILTEAKMVTATVGGAAVSANTDLYFNIVYADNF